MYLKEVFERQISKNIFNNFQKMKEMLSRERMEKIKWKKKNFQQVLFFVMKILHDTTKCMQHQRQQNKSLIFINKKKKFFLQFKDIVGISWYISVYVRRYPRAGSNTQHDKHPSAGQNPQNLWK